MRRITNLSSVLDRKGFTLVELLVALMVTSVILTTVATLAYAMGAANETSDETSRKQAQVRYATLRISDLIRHCRLIYDATDTYLVIWEADENGDNVADAEELTYVETGEGRNYLRLRKLNGSLVVLIPQCSNVRFVFDEPLLPPLQRRFVGILFDVTEKNIIRQYQISAVLGGWAGHLVDADGDEIISDDD